MADFDIMTRADTSSTLKHPREAFRGLAAAGVISIALWASLICVLIR